MVRSDQMTRLKIYEIYICLSAVDLVLLVCERARELPSKASEVSESLLMMMEEKLVEIVVRPMAIIRSIRCLIA